MTPFWSTVLLIFFLYSSGYHRDLHSFPTRRSSDLRSSRLRLLYVGHVGPEDEQLTVDTDRLLLAARDRLSITEDEGLLVGLDRKSTSELQSPVHLVCRLLLEKKKKIQNEQTYTLTS